MLFAPRLRSGMFTATSPALMKATPISSSKVGLSDSSSHARMTVSTGTPRLDILATVALTRHTTDNHSHEPRPEARLAIHAPPQKRPDSHTRKSAVKGKN